MTKQIHTKFTSAEDAFKAQRFLKDNGLEDVSVNGNELLIETTKENWISAYEIANSLGGAFEPNPDLFSELDNQYGLNQQLVDQESKIDIVDREAYVDMNLGYGDFEMIEPYILHRFEKFREDAEGEEK